MTDDAPATDRDASAVHSPAPGESSPPDLTDIGTLKRLLLRHGIRPTKSFGQHLLISRRALRTMVEAADLVPDDSVLEVGAGPGVLTVELAGVVRRVVAVELDRAVLPVLRETTASFPNVEIVPTNLLNIAPDRVFGAAPYKIVANLPYYITSMALRHFLEARARPALLVVMVQREVAERMVAPPGALSMLGISVQFYGTPEIIAYVPAGAFYPPPKVDSAIVRLRVFPVPPLEGAAQERFFGIVGAGFAEKRKQVHNSLARHLDATPEEISAWLAAAAIDPVRRAQTLSVGEWLALARAAGSTTVANRPYDTAGH